MDAGFAMSRPDVAAAASAMRGVAADLRQEVNGLRATLDALGDVSGGDEQGRAFAAGYDPRAAEGLRTLDALARALATVPDALAGTAESFAAADADGARTIRRPP